MQHLLLLLGLSLLSAPVRADSSHLDRVLAAKELRVCIGSARSHKLDTIVELR